MKSFFVCVVMICSLLLANCGSQDDTIFQQEPDGETQETANQDGNSAVSTSALSSQSAKI